MQPLAGRAPHTPMLASMPVEPTSIPSGVVLIPVKAFDEAKGRLSGALAPNDRSHLARRMATHVVNAQGDVTVVVCCDDEGVADWARSVGAQVAWCPGTDLNGAVQQGIEQLRSAGYGSVAIAHSDLPLASSLKPLLSWPGVTIVPDRHRTGTNVMSFPLSIDFNVSYGESSFHRHIAEAVRHGSGLRIVHDDALGVDIDNPADLDLPETTFLSDLLESNSGSESESV